MEGLLSVNIKISGKGMIRKKTFSCKKSASRRLKAYMSVESSAVFSIILLWFLFFFLLSFRLFNECLESQKNYIKGFYEERFSEMEEEYKGIIWGNTEKGIYVTPSGIWHINPLEE